MMRGVSTWAVAVRKPSQAQVDASTRARRSRSRRRDRGRLRAARLVDEAPPRLPAADHPRRRGARRVAQDRLQGARHLRQRAAHRGREGRGSRRSAAPRGRARSRSRSLLADRAVLPAAGRADQPLQGRDPELVRVRGDREAHPNLDLPRLPVADLAHEGPAARLRVPRRRAQDDLVLRGGARR